MVKKVRKKVSLILFKYDRFRSKDQGSKEQKRHCSRLGKDG